MVTCRNLYKRYGQSVTALDGVSLHIKPGTITGLLGPNGSGKTTLVRILAGSIRDFTGEVTVMAKKLPTRGLAENIGYMPQHYALYSELTVRENLEFFGSIYKAGNPAECRRRSDALIEVLGLGDKRSVRVHQLSGGMKQRVSLGCALLHKPKLLLLDEPTIGLDPELRIQFWDYFAVLVREGATILMTTHTFDEARNCSDLVFIKNGRIIASDTIDAISRRTGTEDIERSYIKLLHDAGEDGNKEAGK